MTREQEQRIKQTVGTPGWEDIKAEAFATAEKFKLQALVNTDESQVLPLWREAQAAFKILSVFIERIEGGIAQEETQ